MVPSTHDLERKWEREGNQLIFKNNIVLVKNQNQNNKLQVLLGSMKKVKA
jgi:hypothetical protein